MVPLLNSTTEKRKGTLILTSLLEDLDGQLWQANAVRILDPCAKCLDSRYAKDWNKRGGAAGMWGPDGAGKLGNYVFFRGRIIDRSLNKFYRSSFFEDLKVYKVTASTLKSPCYFSRSKCHGTPRELHRQVPSSRPWQWSLTAGPSTSSTGKAAA